MPLIVFSNKDMKGKPFLIFIFGDAISSPHSFFYDGLAWYIRIMLVKKKSLKSCPSLFY